MTQDGWGCLRKKSLDISFTFMKLCLLCRLVLHAQTSLVPAPLPADKQREAKERREGKNDGGTREDAVAQPWMRKRKKGWREKDNTAREKSFCVRFSCSAAGRFAELQCNCLLCTHPPHHHHLHCRGGSTLPSYPRGEGKKYPPISLRSWWGFITDLRQALLISPATWNTHNGLHCFPHMETPFCGYLFIAWKRDKGRNKTGRAHSSHFSIFLPPAEDGLTFTRVFSTHPDSYIPHQLRHGGDHRMLTLQQACVELTGDRGEHRRREGMTVGAHLPAETGLTPHCSMIGCMISKAACFLLKLSFSTLGGCSLNACARLCRWLSSLQTGHRCSEALNED